MSSLSWISDEDLLKAVHSLQNRANEADSKSAERIKKNVVDPFSSLIIASSLAVDSTSSLVSIQKSASALSGISNALGHFHQNILGSVRGWENHDAGYDLESSSEKMLAEVKNKHNTMNASNKATVISDLDTAIRQKGAGWTGYLVVIVPKRPVRYERHLKTSRPVYEIDGASFYSKVTGYEKALHQLFDVLMIMLESINQRIVPSDIKSYCHSMMKNIPE